MSSDLYKIFTEEQSEFLENEMCIKIQEFEEDLRLKFNDAAINFRYVIDFFLSYQEKEAFKLYRHEAVCSYECKLRKQLDTFIIKNSLSLNVQDGDDIGNYYYDLMWYFIRYWTGGLKEVFVNREAKDNGPRIYLDKKLSTDEELSELPDSIVIYRGMAREEFESNKFGMSWSLKPDVAIKFAQDSNALDTVVVKSIIQKQDVLLYCKDRNEEEIVVKDKTITRGVLYWESNAELK